MNAAIQQLLSNALELPDSDRAELAAMLIESLDASAEEEVEQAWETELNRRMEEFDNHTVNAIPWPAARRMIMGLP